MKSQHTLLAATVIFTTTILSVSAGDQPQTASNSKSQYNLLNPTPAAQMRELSPDRPDATESPLTVDAGHFAMEVSLFDWRHDGGNNGYTAMSTNLKLGLTNNTDLQLVFDTFSKQKPSTGGGAEGFGDIQLRLKHNIWGNDEGKTAFALFPFIKIPTGTAVSNNEWEGGLILPFSVELTDSVGLGLMGEFDVTYDDTQARHEIEFLHSAVLGFDLTDRVGAFVEYVGIIGDNPYQAYLGGGFTYSINENFVLDLGAQAGLNHDSEDLGVFTGYTKRF